MPHGSAQVRQEKREQFEAPRSRVKVHLVAAGVALLPIVAVALYAVMGRGESSTAAAQTAAVGGNVRIALSELASGEAQFYTYDSGGAAIKYFALRTPDGKFRTAFDACNVCFANKKGYRQDGADMVCNNCGQKIAATTISVLKSDCNPVPIGNKIKGDSLVLKSVALDAGDKYFQ